MTDSVAGTIFNRYDSLDGLIAEATRLGTVTYQYDALGRRTAMIPPGQPTVTYGYDAASRLTAITQASQLVTSIVDAAGRRTRITLPNGVSTDYQYDAASRLTTLTYRNAGGVLGSLTYEYDGAGNRSSVSGSFARTLLPAPVTSATYNAANRQLTFGGRSLTYDLNGNVTNDGTQSYVWDARDRLVALEGLTPASFEYDALGRRATKTIGGMTTAFVYDGFNAVEELTLSTTTQVLAGLGIDEYLTRTDGVSGRHTLLTDGLGSVLALANDSGVVDTEYTYEPFGATTPTGAASNNAFQYTGRENDGTGLYYYRARYYHPGLQRFTSEDPIGLLAGDTNYYSYVSNDPANSIDPTGDVLVAGCIAGGAFSVAVDIGSYVIGGRKTSVGEAVGNAVIGCVSGAVGAKAFQLAGKGAAYAARSLRNVLSGARSESMNLAEQLVLREAQAGGGERILEGTIGDWAFPESIWAKMQVFHRPQVGVSITDKGVTSWQQLPTITVHYCQNIQTGARMGFKFVSPP